MIIALILFGWVSCSIAAYGLTLGDWQRRFPYMRHTGDSVATALFGPISLALTLVFVERPLRFAIYPLTIRERWFFFKSQYYPGYKTFEQFVAEYGGGWQVRAMRRAEKRKEAARLEAQLAAARESAR